jgi:hypothetical protein
MAGGSSTLIYPDAVTLIRARLDDPVTVSVGNDTLRYGTTRTDLSSSLAAGQSVLFTSDRYVKTDADGAVLLVTADPWDRPENVELGELSAETIAAIAAQVEVPYSVLNLTGNPEAVTDWGAIINTALAAGQRQFFFPAGEYPFSTQIATNGRASVVFQGEGGRVDHYGNVQGIERMQSYLLWDGADATSPIANAASIGFTMRNLGVYYENDTFSGTLIDWDSNSVHGMIDSCDLGSLDQEFTSAHAIITYTDSWNCTIQNSNLHGADWAILGGAANFSDSLRVLNNYFSKCAIAYIGAISGSGSTEWSIDHNTFGMGEASPSEGDPWATPRVIDLPASVTDPQYSYFSFTNNTVLDDTQNDEAWFRQMANNYWYATFSGNAILRNHDEGVFDLQGGGIINIVNNPTLGVNTGGFVVDLGDVTGDAEPKSFTFRGNYFTADDEAILNRDGHLYLDIQVESQTGYSLDVRTLGGHERIARYADASEPRPTIAAEAALGSGPATQILGNDLAGYVQFSNGSGATGGEQVTITLGTPQTSTPDTLDRLHVTLTPTNSFGAAAMATGVWVDSSDLETFSIHTTDAISNTTGFNYRVLGT